MASHSRKPEDDPQAPAGMPESDFVAAVGESAQQIWLAGLGAFAKTQQEGSKVFEALVKEGIGLQRRTQALAEKQVGEVAGKISGLAGQVGGQASQHWDRLEGIFEERVAKAMGRLGVPSTAEMEALRGRVDALARAVDELSRSARAPARRAPKESDHPRAGRTPGTDSGKGD